MSKIYDKSYTKKFTLTGNKIGEEVRKANSKLGDGEIGSGSGGYVIPKVAAGLRLIGRKQVAVDLTYSVIEDNFGKKSGDDSLYIKKTFFVDISDFTDVKTGTRIEGNKRITTTSTVELQDRKGGKTPVNAQYQSRVETDKKQHGILSSLTWEAKTGFQPWLPQNMIRVKIDGPGNELKKTGNLYLSVEVTFNIRRIDNVVTETIVQERPLPNDKRRGHGRVIESISDVVRTTLGCGYDITGDYAQASSSKYPVVDLDSLNRHYHLLKKTLNKSDCQSASGESMREYTSDITEKLSVKVSANAFGASFSNETNKSFNEKQTSKETCKYARKDFLFIDDTYEVDDAIQPERLIPFLSRGFKSDLATMYPGEFIKRYGTHVVLGMAVGGRLSYNMRYKESILSKSTAKTFENTTKIGFSSNGTPKEPAKSANPTGAAIEKLFDELGKTNDADKIAKLAGAIAALNGVKNTKTTSGGGSSNGGSSNGGSSGGGSKGFGFSAEVTVSESETQTFSSEDKSTDISCYTVGGNASMAGSFILDETKYEKWGDTVKDNPAFVAFLPGTIVPIEELVPESGYRLTRANVAEASASYQEERGMLIPAPEEYNFKEEFNTLAKENTKVLNSDPEISSKPDKKTGWEACVEMVHLGDGGAACTISLTVHENGINMGQSKLQNTLIIPIPKLNYSQLVVNTKGSTSFRTQGFIIGESHGWVDVRDDFKGCEFLNLNDGVYIKVDGPDDDEGNIGMVGTLDVDLLAYYD